MAPTVLASTISFLDTMDTSEYLPMLIEILVYFSEHYQNLFGQRFKVRYMLHGIKLLLTRSFEGYH
jgi:hypothetical protein